MVRARPDASEPRPVSPTSGRGLAVFGSFFGAGADGAAEAPEVEVAEADGEADGGGVRAGAAAGAGADVEAGAAAGDAALARVAFTSFSVITLGGLVVMIVAEILSFSRKSEICAGWPLRMILIPRLSMSLCVNIL